MVCLFIAPVKMEKGKGFIKTIIKNRLYLFCFSFFNGGYHRICNIYNKEYGLKRRLLSPIHSVCFVLEEFYWFLFVSYPRSHQLHYQNIQIKLVSSQLTYCWPKIVMCRLICLTLYLEHLVAVTTWVIPTIRQTAAEPR